MGGTQVKHSRMNTEAVTDFNGLEQSLADLNGLFMDFIGNAGEGPKLIKQPKEGLQLA